MTDPRELHPNPSFVVVIGGRFLIELEFFNNCFCVEVFQVFKIFRFGFIFLNIFDFGYQVVGLNFFIRILIFVLFIIVKSLGFFLFFFKRNFLQKALNFIIVMISKIIFIALDFNI